MNSAALALRYCARLGAGAALMAVTLFVSAGAEDAETAHPAHIHSGTCQTLGDVVAPLTDVAPKAAAAPTALPAALPLETSKTRVEMPLQAIIDGGHAINVHASADEIGVYIACGDVGGVIDDEALAIGLSEVNHSGYSGVAVLERDDEATEVTVYLLAPAATGASGTPTAQAASPAATKTVSVEIKGFKYAPATIEVPAGGSITWINQDNPPHTVTGVDRAVADSGTLAFDQSFTQEFGTPGTYEYFCVFHPGMKGTIVVK